MKMAFKTYYSYFEYQMISLKLINISAIFQGYINKILAEKLDVFVMVCLNDILIYIKSDGKKYVEVVRWVLE